MLTDTIGMSYGVVYSKEARVHINFNHHRVNKNAHSSLYDTSRILCGVQSFGNLHHRTNQTNPRRAKRYNDQNGFKFHFCASDIIKKRP